jgi:hypothetical protein
MPVYQNKYKYQLIHPIVGTRVYQTTSLKRGAKKCYEELKSLNNINSPSFTVLNVDTYETFKFRIDSTKVNGALAGSNGAKSIDQEGIDELRKTIGDLHARVKKLEDQSKPLKLTEGVIRDLPVLKNDNDDIMAEALSRNIRNTNFRGLDMVQKLNQGSSVNRKDGGDISGYCSIM